jgi:hypothetical protein
MSNYVPRVGPTMEDTLKMLLKDLAWIMRKLDSKNVKRLFTEECDIASTEGETQIKGPLILMYDKQDPPVLRRKIGYDPDSSLFVDEWYNPLGVLTAYIDTNGKLIVVDGEFKGTIDIGSGNFTVDAAGNVTVKTNMHVGNAVYIGNNDAINKTVRLRTSGGADVILQGWTDIGPGLDIGYRNANSPDTDPISELDFVSIFATTLNFMGTYLSGNFDCLDAVFTRLSNGVSLYATQAWAAQKGSSTGNNSHTHTVVVNGTTYTTSSETHSHSQT